MNTSFAAAAENDCVNVLSYLEMSLRQQGRMFDASLVKECKLLMQREIKAEAYAKRPSAANLSNGLQTPI